MNPTEPITNTELAAFVFLLFRVHDDNNQPRASFQAQLDAFPVLGGEFDTLTQRVNLLKAFYAEAAHTPTVNAAHLALKNLFDELHATNLWGECKTVDIEQIKNISLGADIAL